MASGKGYGSWKGVETEEREKADRDIRKGGGKKKGGKNYAGKRKTEMRKHRKRKKGGWKE